MTDPRIDDLAAVIMRLPKRSGIIFRHYYMPRRERRTLFDQVRKLARRQRHLLLLADLPRVARQWGADGAHDRSRHQSQGIRTVAVHNMREAVSAKRLRADLIFISPVFATRSHSGMKGLGPVGVGQIIGNQRHCAIALGGMTARRAKSLAALNLHGWAAIDALSLSKG